ncbi:DUF4190 domain-containing protein [Salipaludibacillus sp. HK11]|uniref:DUF4190 domain-containing protein n=1 Tax=Salipaludibacillus sp. HK11 TaxID=3394320 RepID=UPI0039FC3234
MENQNQDNFQEKNASQYNYNVKAIISGVTGALSVIFFFLILPVGMFLGFFSVLFGIIALFEIKTTKQHGKLIAVLGFIGGAITVALPFLVIFFAIITGY